MTRSFRDIFSQGDVKSIEIPIIQRDYAQGRQDGAVPRIRRAFLKVLHGALTGGEAVGLDFIYGEVERDVMIPLDGQQRLTTLFLLHWYLAARNGIGVDDCDFLGKFTYETRYSARDFCKYLTAQRPPFPPDPCLSGWLRDQRGYIGAWKNDPTIKAMLVVLDDIDSLFRDANCQTAWQLLIAEDKPAITFESLSLTNMGLTDDLYIKMNSRGKPLTSFEHFKAGFEQTLQKVSVAHGDKFVGQESPYDEFVRKVDQEWSDLLWPLRDENDIIDKEFLCLFHFITDILIHRNKLNVEIDLFDEDIDDWVDCVYGEKGEAPLSAQSFMFAAFDSLFAHFGRMRDAGKIDEWFRTIFQEKGYHDGAVAIFDPQLDLFRACCKSYGIVDAGGKNRLFSLPRTLLLFAVLEHLQAKQTLEDFTPRLRVVRNLIFASADNQIRVENFPALLNETAEIIRSGDLATILTYNNRQTEEEKKKAEFLARYPGYSNLREVLHRLEDHDLLRGCIAAFDLEVGPDIFKRRAQLFHEVFSEDGKLPAKDIGAALLACGDYSRKMRNDRWQFGSPEQSRASVWRELLTNSASTEFAQTSSVLLQMLDALATIPGASVQERVRTIVDLYLAVQEKNRLFDWRYYLVKYPAMREGISGLYVSSSGAMGFDLCMMDQKRLSSYYRDPYLFAVIALSGAKEGHDIANLRHYGLDGFRPESRWIELLRTGEKVMSCRMEGFQLQAPTEVAGQASFTTILQKNNASADLMLRVQQKEVDGVQYDQEDRISVGANFLRDLINIWH